MACQLISALINSRMRAISLCKFKYSLCFRALEVIIKYVRLFSRRGSFRSFSLGNSKLLASMPRVS